MMEKNKDYKKAYEELRALVMRFMTKELTMSGFVDAMYEIHWDIKAEMKKKKLEIRKS